MQSNWKDSIIIAMRFFGKAKIDVHFIRSINNKVIPKTSKIS